MRSRHRAGKDVDKATKGNMQIRPDMDRVVAEAVRAQKTIPMICDLLQQRPTERYLRYVVVECKGAVATTAVHDRVEEHGSERVDKNHGRLLRERQHRAKHLFRRVSQFWRRLVVHGRLNEDQVTVDATSDAAFQ